MDTAPAARPIPLFLTMLVAFFSALAALSIANGHDARAHDDARRLFAAPATPSHVAAVGLKELALRNRMRELWEDHITWTRLAIIGLTAGSPDTPAAVARLLKNQTDIGNAIKPFYGERSGNELTRQLRNHILIAADLVMAAKAADEARLAAVRARWETNADAIAMVLASVNPRSWPPARMRSELGTRAHPGRLDGRRGRLRQGPPPRAPLRRPALRGRGQAVPEAVPLVARPAGKDRVGRDTKEGMRIDATDERPRTTS